MWRALTLSNRIYLLLTALLVITFGGGAVMVWHTYRMERVVTEIIDREGMAYETAHALETALVNQKGFVTYYFLDGNPEWLRQFGEYRQLFKTLMAKTRVLAETEAQKQVIDRIAEEYNHYITIKDQVIDYYMAGEREAGARLHKEVRERFFRVLRVSEEFKNLIRETMTQTKIKSQQEARDLRIIAGVGLGLDVVLAVLLVMILVRNILKPVRELARAADRQRDRILRSDNEIAALSRSVRGLLEDVDLTQSELERSREHLIQSEKMAVVGKLAAGMAHSIRNPFTSIKMRLFSLNRTLALSETQKEDFDVIAEEIRHLDTIVQNFLEFARPPKLRMQRISPSAVVDMTLQLLAHRLGAYDVAVKLDRSETLPEVEADPEQLKEVLVNLIINACEAMRRDGSGRIIVKESRVSGDGRAEAVEIRLSDNGAGIPEGIRHKIFQPFFTTKEEGTGLGLSIASRIIQEHKGSISVDSLDGEGATFTIRLPVWDACSMVPEPSRRFEETGT